MEHATIHPHTSKTQPHSRPPPLPGCVAPSPRSPPFPTPTRVSAPLPSSASQLTRTLQVQGWYAAMPHHITTLQLLQPRPLWRRSPHITSTAAARAPQHITISRPGVQGAQAVGHRQRKGTYKAIHRGGGGELYSTRQLHLTGSTDNFSNFSIKQAHCILKVPPTHCAVCMRCCSVSEGHKAAATSLMNTRQSLKAPPTNARHTTWQLSCAQAHSRHPSIAQPSPSKIHLCTPSIAQTHSKQAITPQHRGTAQHAFQGKTAPRPTS